MIRTKPLKRRFLPENLNIKTWADVAPYAKKLLKRPINSVKDFRNFLKDESEFHRVFWGTYLDLDHSWSLKMNDKKRKNNIDRLMKNGLKEALLFECEMEKKILASPHSKKMKDDVYQWHLTSLTDYVKVFRKKDIPLYYRDCIISTRNTVAMSQLSAEFDGKKQLIAHIIPEMGSNDRKRRKMAWDAVWNTRRANKEKFDATYDRLVKIRHKVGDNRYFKNYRDTTYFNDPKRGKFDTEVTYTAEQCLQFHSDIEKIVMPMVEKIHKKRAQGLNVKKLRPWDFSTKPGYHSAPDPKGRPQVQAFKSEEDLTHRGNKILYDIHPFFGQAANKIVKSGYADLMSRPHKYAGAYCMPQPEKRLPAVMGNFTGDATDATIYIHEFGHAIHFTKTNEIDLEIFKSPPAEVCEFFAMGMELLAFNKWDEFYENRADCCRVQKEHLENIIQFMPYMAKIDAFQHEVYTKPEMTPDERHKTFLKIQKRFGSSYEDWRGETDVRAMLWHQQGHVFSDPFYYVEYGMAQLGAIQLWMKYEKQPKRTVNKFINAMALGYKENTEDIYKTAGVEFDFSAPMIKKCMVFIQDKLKKLELEDEYGGKLTPYISAPRGKAGNKPTNNSRQYSKPRAA